MPVRAVGPIGPQYYGWVERTFIHGLTPHLSELSRAGMSTYGIAAELNRRKVSAVNGVPWEADSVTSATNLMKILEPNWRNCPPFKPFLGISHHARTRMTRPAQFDGPRHAGPKLSPEQTAVPPGSGRVPRPRREKPRKK